MPGHGSGRPGGLISYGPDENCTLADCPVEWSVLEYRPSLAASSVFIALFGIAMIIHIVLGIRWRTWGYMTAMVLGCVCEIIGYGGRIILWNNPFSFPGFLIQIICITISPVFFCAAIYVTLSQTINYLDRSISRFSPRLLYWIFIPCDVVSLALQAGGGGASSQSSGSNNISVNVTLAGLSFQVFTLLVFIVLGADYLIRYFRSARQQKTPFNVKFFLTFLSLAIILILLRCSYRIDELSGGYFGPLFHEQGLFIGLESGVMALAVYVLALSQPGYGLKGRGKSAEGYSSEEAKPVGV